MVTCQSFNCTLGKVTFSNQCSTSSRGCRASQSLLGSVRRSHMSEKFPSAPCGHLRKLPISAKAGILQSAFTAQLFPSSENCKKRWSIPLSISFGDWWAGELFLCFSVSFCSSSAQPLCGQRGGLGAAVSACVSLRLNQALLCKEGLFWDSLVPFSVASKKNENPKREQEDLLRSQRRANSC